MAAVTTAVVAGLGVGMQAYGMYESGRAAKKAAKLNAQDALINAELAKKRAAEDERQFRLAFKKDMGRNVTNIAASGIKLEGSPLEVLQDNAAMAEGDALRIREGGDIESSAYLRQARMYRQGGAAASRAAGIGTAATLLSGAADTYNVGRKSGAWE